MKKRIFGLVVVLLAVSFLFTACQRPASVSPTTAPVATDSEIPFPVATQPQIMVDILKSTQTAAALTTHSTETSPILKTSTPAFTFNTPMANTTPAVGGETTPMAGVTPSPMALTTPVPTKIIYPTPTPGRPTTYILQAGEFPWCIARRFNVNIADLLNQNGMDVNSRPAIGTSLNIPTSGSFDGARALKTHPATYTVLAGDTMGKIACSFGDADPNTINAANGLTAGTVLTPGQILQIP